MIVEQQQVFFTLLAARLTQNPSLVVAIEPSPSRRNWLHKNLQRNKLDRVRVLDVAIADHPGKRLFLDRATSPSGGAFSEKGNIEVQVETLDTLSREWQKPDFIKIDVETAEEKVLKGAKTLLATKRPMICLSCHGGPLFPACKKILDSFGYQFKLIEGNLEFGTTLWSPS